MAALNPRSPSSRVSRTGVLCPRSWDKNRRICGTRGSGACKNPRASDGLRYAVLPEWSSSRRPFFAGKTGSSPGNGCQRPARPVACSWPLKDRTDRERRRNASFSRPGCNPKASTRAERKLIISIFELLDIELRRTSSARIFSTLMRSLNSTIYVAAPRTFRLFRAALHVVHC